MKGKVVEMDDEVTETEEEPECMHWHRLVAAHEAGCRPAEPNP